MFIPQRAPKPDDHSAPAPVAGGAGVEQIISKLQVGPDCLPPTEDISLPATFSFSWAGLTFNGTLDRPPRADGHVISLTALLGRLPYSAEDGAARTAVLAELNQTYKLRDGIYDLTADGQVRFRAATSFAGTLSPETLLHAVAVTLLQLKPLLKAFDGLLRPL